MTDLVCEYEPWKGGLVHKGMKVIMLYHYSIQLSNTFHTKSHQQLGFLDISRQSLLHM